MATGASADAASGERRFGNSSCVYPHVYRVVSVLDLDYVYPANIRTRFDVVWRRDDKLKCNIFDPETILNDSLVLVPGTFSSVL